jgi:GTP-binding protein
MAAQGGKGGRGNLRFVTSTRRAPEVAEQGLPGQARRIRCELKLLADAGIVGMPNAGKSTLLSRISSARPKIAEYPFTTLVPQLGIVRLDEDHTFVVADMPGILQGASSGAGLGLRFLRHIERADVLLFLVDLTDPGEEDPLRTYRILTEELAHYSPKLLGKRRILALNKIDLPVARSRMQQLLGKKAPDGLELLFVSSRTGEGIRTHVRSLAETVGAGRDEQSIPSSEGIEPGRDSAQHRSGKASVDSG